MTDTLQAAESYEIISEADRIESPLRVLKHGDSFGVFDQHGDIVAGEGGAQGFYYNDTRFLARLEVAIASRRPLLLSSSVTDDNTVFTVDLTNPEIRRGETPVVARGQIHVFRSIVLCNGSAYQRVRVSNYGLEPVELPFTVSFDSDFADLFEVRGTRRTARGTIGPVTIGLSSAILSYRGLDNVERKTRIEWNRRPESLEAGVAVFMLELGPKASTTLDMTVTCEISQAASDSVRLPLGHDEAVSETLSQSIEWRAGGCRVSTNSESFNRWLARSEADLEMMITQTPHGRYPYAGVPWFSTVFGRDGIITAMELLWAQPTLAEGVLSFLAATQATRVSDAQDAQPGKILHELRGGEMAALGEVPFARYYGSIDATPLFVILAAAYYQRTADHTVMNRIWPNVCAAVEWMESTVTSTATASSSTRAGLQRVWCSRDGRTRTTRCSTKMGRWPRRRSRCARCRPTRTARGSAPRNLRGSAARSIWRRNGGSAPRCCAAGSTTRSGATRSARTRWRSMDRSARAASARRTLHTAC